MTLSEDSRIVRWAYLFYMRHGIPERTSLCAIFWRSVLITPLQLVVFVPIGAFILGVDLFDDHVGSRYRNWRYNRRQRRRRRAVDAPLIVRNEPSAFQVLWLGAKAVKQRVCPIVSIAKATPPAPSSTGEE